jgi:hypothetical protein
MENGVMQNAEWGMGNGIFGHDHTLLLCGNSDDFGIAGRIAIGQIKGVKSIVPGPAEDSNQATRKVGIQQEFHTGSSSTRFTWLRWAA